MKKSDREAVALVEDTEALASQSVETLGEGVKISEEVVKVIAGIAASEVEGVAGMSGGLVGGIAEMLGRKNLSRGIKVQLGDRQAALDVFLIVRYGVNIPAVAQRVQESVKEAVETMTGLKVTQVNIHVQGVSFGPEEGEREARAH